jgi:hypothetical protein
VTGQTRTKYIYFFEKVRLYQQNYLEHTLRIPTVRFLGSCLATTLKEEEREVDRQIDGRINSSNPKIKAGQKA